MSDLTIIRAISEPVEFWMIWTKTGHAPRKVHTTRVDADREALRLAALHPGRKFIVLQAVDKVHVPAPAVAEQVAA